MTINDLKAQFESAQQKSRELTAQIERTETDLKSLRQQRVMLLAPTGLGDTGAARDLERTDVSIRAALQRQRTLNETRREVHFAGESKRWELLRSLVLAELGRLPDLESNLAASMKPLSKAIAAVDASDIGSLARQFIGPGLGRFTGAGAALRSELSKAINAALIAVLENPGAPPAVSLANVEGSLRGVLTGISAMEGQVARRLATARMQAEVDRAELERHMAP